VIDRLWEGRRSTHLSRVGTKEFLKEGETAAGENEGAFVVRLNLLQAHHALERLAYLRRPCVSQAAEKQQEDKTNQWRLAAQPFLAELEGALQVCL